MRVFLGFILILNTFLFTNCGTNNVSKDKIDSVAVKSDWVHKMEPIATELKAGLRGLVVLDAKTVWVSGQNATWGKTIDNGAAWTFDSIEAARGLDFRSVYAFDANEAFLLTAGSPALLFKTKDGGKSWGIVYENSHEKVFFDGLKFWDHERGLAFSDPIDGKLFIIKTLDGGNTWSKIDTVKIPSALKNEAGFAASGTGIWLGSNGAAFIGLGGDKARVFKSVNYGEDWVVLETPVQSGSSSKGIYSLDMMSDKVGVVAGGDYTMPEANNNIATTEDGGETWKLAKTKVEYKECVKFVPDLGKFYIVAVGPTGIDLSKDLGAHWTKIDSVNGFHTIDFPVKQLKSDEVVGWMTGSKGKIARISFLKN